MCTHPDSHYRQHGVTLIELIVFIVIVSLAAAGVLLVSEAGGTVTDVDGGDAMLTGGSICAANPSLHPMLLERLKAAA